MKNHVARRFLISSLLAALIGLSVFTKFNASALPLPTISPTSPPTFTPINLDISGDFKDANFKQCVWHWLGKSGEPGVITKQDIKDKINTTPVLSINSASIKSLEGLEHFEGIKQLYVSSNQLITLPQLPTTLEKLSCSENRLTSLPPLPASLVDLNVSNNLLTDMPDVPDGIKTLRISYNKITSIKIPPNIEYFFCEGLSLKSLPPLPASLKGLYCSDNKLTSLPDFPNGFHGIFCEKNRLTSLPELPTSMTFLYCSDNKLTSLPDLPYGMESLVCSSNELTSLPQLPSTLLYLICSNNKLNGIATLPSGLAELDCSNNNLTSLPAIPPALHTLDFSNNLITSLPGPSTNYYKFNCKYNYLNIFENPLKAQINNLTVVAKEYYPQYRLSYKGDEVQISIGQTRQIGESEIKKQMSSDGNVWGDVENIGLSNITFTSSNNSVAKVDSAGMITGVGEGTCTINALLKGIDTALTRTSITVKVSDQVFDPGINPPETPAQQGIDYSTADSWAVSELQQAEQYNLITEKVNKDLQRDITREEFCSIIVKLYEALSGKKALPCVLNPFRDTNDGDILKAFELGIIKGKAPDLFKPNDIITRQEICVMFFRAIKAAKPTLNFDTSGVAAFADENQIADWAINEVRFCAKHGIMKGTGNNNITPLVTADRQAGIILVKRTYEVFKNQ